jgi:hypothetical protein
MENTVVAHEKYLAKDELCGGECGHDKSYHVVKPIGSTDLGCCKVDCKCMKFVPRPKPAEA